MINAKVIMELNNNYIRSFILHYQIITGYCGIGTSINLSKRLIIIKTNKHDGIGKHKMC